MFSKYVYKLLVRWYISSIQISKCHFFPYKVIVKFYVFGSSMEYCIFLDIWMALMLSQKNSDVLC